MAVWFRSTLFKLNEKVCTVVDDDGATDLVIAQGVGATVTGFVTESVGIYQNNHPCSFEQ